MTDLEQKVADLESLIRQKAAGIKEFFFDVDGVMTPQGAITIYDVQGSTVPNSFERKDGIVSTRLVPCDEYGTPLLNVVEYIAGYGDGLIMEGYRFDPRDGKVVEYLVANKFPVYFISGRDSACVRKRALALGAIPLLGIKDKLSMMQEVVKCSFDQVLFVGDGIQDVNVLQMVGVAIAPRDASPEAIAAAHAVTNARGGGGVLNEILSIFLKQRGLWPS